MCTEDRCSPNPDPTLCPADGSVQGLEVHGFSLLVEGDTAKATLQLSQIILDLMMNTKLPDTT